MVLADAPLTGVLTEMIEYITEGVTAYGQAVGSSISSTVTAMFIETVGEGSSAVQHLSTFGAVTVIFCGLGLAVSLCVLLFRFLTSFGARA